MERISKDFLRVKAKCREMLRNRLLCAATFVSVAALLFDILQAKSTSITFLEETASRI